MAAVSIQLMPRSRAARIACTDSLSSWAPQPKAHPLPPIAQAPTPIGVSFISLLPSCFVCIPIRIDDSPGGTMPETQAQTYESHTRMDPAFHYFLAPVALINVLLAIYNLTRHFTFVDAWLVILAIAFLVAIFK